MKFWGVEVKSGENVVVKPGKDMLLHVSQACLGGIKNEKGSGYVRLYARKDGATFVLGILSPEKFPHKNFDVVFEDDFELYHDGKHESVHFAGYRALNPDMGEEEIESDDSDGERVPVNALDNVKSESKEVKAAPTKVIAPANAEKAAGKAKVTIIEPNKDANQNEDDDDDDSDEDDSEDGSEEDEDVDGESEDDDDNSDEDSDDESDEETPKKPETSTKRSAEASNKTTVPNKKAKFATPVKTDGKKHVPHVATPHPAKQAGKTPAADSDKSKQQNPKPSGSVACSSCNRSFGSEQALQSHSKAKHGAK